MIVVAAVALLTRMFEPISAWILSSLTSLFTFSSFVFIVITSKYVIVVSYLLKLLFVCNLFKLFFLVPVWISADVAMLLSLLFQWVASFLEWLLLLLLLIIKVLWRLMVIILRYLAHHNCLFAKSWMCLIIRIMLVMLILLRLTVLLRSVVRNSVRDLLLWRWLLWLVLGLVLLLAGLLVLELRGHFVISWNGWSHADDCWNFSFIFRWSLILRLGLTLVIIIISISLNALWRLGKIVITMRILIISSSSFLSGAKLWITLIKLLCHWFVNGLSNCIILWFFSVVSAHKIMIIHIFLNASWRSAWIFDVALIDILDLLNVSLYHIEISRFKLFCFL